VAAGRFAYFMFFTFRLSLPVSFCYRFVSKPRRGIFDAPKASDVLLRFRYFFFRCLVVYGLIPNFIVIGDDR